MILDNTTNATTPTAARRQSETRYFPLMSVPSLKLSSVVLNQKITSVMNGAIP